MIDIIITAPSLDPTQNVSGVSSVVQFIIDNNKECRYRHFQLGKADKDNSRLKSVWTNLKALWKWRKVTDMTSESSSEAIIHYSFPLSAPSILRDPLFMYCARRKGCKMVVHVHGGLFLTAPTIPFLLNRILRWVFAWDVTFIVLSEKEKELVQSRFGAKKVEVLANCVTIPAMEVKDEGLEDSGDVPLVLGYLGRIEPNKGMTELLEACKRLKAEGVPFRLRFAGKEEREGEYLPLYKDALGDVFEYVGLVSGKSKDEFLRNLDVFVMPTYFEGLPMSLLECMSYGSVPVVTGVGSIPTVVRSSGLVSDMASCQDNGLFLKVKDVDSIVDAVRLLHKHRDMVSLLGANARRTIEDNFSVERYVRKLNEIYCSVIQ